MGRVMTMWAVALEVGVVVLQLFLIDCKKVNDKGKCNCTLLECEKSLSTAIYMIARGGEWGFRVPLCAVEPTVATQICGSIMVARRWHTEFLLHASGRVPQSPVRLSVQPTPTTRPSRWTSNVRDGEGLEGNNLESWKQI